MRPEDIIILVILLAGAGVWAVLNERRRRQLSDEFHLDPRLILPFKDVTFGWDDLGAPERDEVPLWAWIAAAGLFVAAFVLLSRCMAVDHHWEYYLAGSIGCFVLTPLLLLLARTRVPPVVIPHRCDLTRSSITVASQGQSAVFDVGPSLLIVLHVEEVIRKRGFGELTWEEFMGFNYKLRVQDGSRDVEVPMVFVGSGEFLAACLHRGAKVEFAPGCPDWLVRKMKDLPSWRPGYFDASKAPAPELLGDFVCTACGGHGRYPKTGLSHLCQYCGSGRLSPA